MNMETKSGWVRTSVTVLSTALMILTGGVGLYVTMVQKIDGNSRDIVSVKSDIEELKADRRQDRADAARDRDAIGELKGDMKAVRQSLEYLVNAARQHQPAKQ